MAVFSKRLGLILLLGVAPSAWAGQVTKVTPLSDYALVGDPYHAVGDWVSDGALKISLRINTWNGRSVDPTSLRYELQGDVIKLHFTVLDLSKNADGSAKDCKGMPPAAQLTYAITDIAHRDYRYEVDGYPGSSPRPLATLQQAKALNLPSSFDLTVQKDNTILLGSRQVTLDDLDNLFFKAEPYQLMVNIRTTSDRGLDIYSLAEEHALPYSFPNLDKLLSRPVDEVYAEIKKKISKTGHDRDPHKWLPYGDKTTLPLMADLSLPSASMKAGSTPKFVVTISNGGKEPVKIVKLTSDRGLEPRYFELSLISNGKWVNDVPTAIGDPAPRGPNDWMVVNPGERLPVPYSGFPKILDQLKPGRYDARVIFYFDEMGTSRYIDSNWLSFDVVH